ncbi:MAG: hypothetical protein K2N44_16960 [Lachnospiraceae bacterium]|nr:hypothetical protein [Lachnospiraceae bacterium]
MDNYLGMYVKEYVVLWIKVLIVAGIGVLIDKAIAAEAGMGEMVYVFTIILPSLVYGMTLFNKVVKFDLFGTHDFVLIFWVLKISKYEAVSF